MEERVRVRDFEMHVERIGQGHNLVLLHGNGEDHAIFSGIAPALAAQYSLLLPDSRAHGKSTRGQGELTIHGMGMDLLALMDALKIPSATLVGYSDGGNIALESALLAPERIDGLVLIGANLHPSGLKPLVLCAMALIYAVSVVLAPFSTRHVHRKELYALMVRQPHIASAKLKMLGHIPTLVMAGQKDVIRKNHTKRIAQSIPGAQLRFLSGGHDLIREAGQEVTQQVLNFLSNT